MYLNHCLLSWTLHTCLEKIWGKVTQFEKYLINKTDKWTNTENVNLDMKNKKTEEENSILWLSFSLAPQK